MYILGVINMSWKERAIELSKTRNGLKYTDMAKILNREFGLNLEADEVRRYVQATRGIRNRYGKCSGEKFGFEEDIPPIEEHDDYYIIHRKGGSSIKITKEKLTQFKRLYCGPGYLTLNQCARKLNIPRADLVVIKTAFRITHDDVPFTDEEMNTYTPEQLAEFTLEQKKEKYFLTLQQKEIDSMKRELDMYRKKDYAMQKLAARIEDYFENFAKTYKRPHVKKLVDTKSDRMLEVSIVDLHLSKMAWAPETGENYDSKIAESRFMQVIYDVIQRTRDRKWEKIIFPIGNDFFNFDNVLGATTKGTIQDNDSRLHKMYYVGTELIVKAIDLLHHELKSPVFAFLVPGNHDSLISFFLTHFVWGWFRNNPNITVDSNPMTRKYVEFGKNLIGFTHLDKEKKRIEGNMQVEQPQAWGRTKYREWHGAHLHSEQVREVNGIKIRNLSSITATDAWHFESGYTGAIACSQTFVWHKEKGLEEILYTTIERN